jgi:SPP1 gp7 family putative phage head morphogenesis protein
MNILNLFKKASTTIFTQNKIEEQKPLWSAKITPSEIAIALHNANNGRLRHILSLYDRLYGLDDNLAGDTDVRVEALKSANFVLPEDITQQQKDFFTSFLDNFFPALIDQALDLKLTGSLFTQIVYKLENNLYTIDKFISYEGIDLRAEDSELVLYVEEEKITLPDDKFVRLYQKYSVYESIIKYYAFFSFALNNWASFIEIYGKPVRIGKYKPGSTLEEKNLLKSMVKNLGTDLGAVISENTLIEFADFKNANANANLYSTLLDFCKKSISKRILGQTLTTNTEKTGSYAQAKVHNMVRQDILQADIRDCSKYVSLICSRLNRLNFNDSDIKITLSLPEHIDLNTKINIDTKLNDIIEIEPEYWYKTYAIPIPKAGAKLKEVASQQFPFQNRVGGGSTGNAGILPVSSIPLYGGVARYSPDGVVASKSPSGDLGASLLTGNADGSSALKSSLKELKKIKSSIKNAKSFKDIENMAYPKDLYLTFANEMYQTILQDYYTQRKASLARNATSSIPLYGGVDGTPDGVVNFPNIIAKRYNNSSLFTLNSSLMKSPSGASEDFNFEIDWTLEDTKALNAFRAETFIVAGVTSDTMLDMIKSESEKAFTEGITFNDFKENLKLNGFEPDNPYHLRTNFNQAIKSARASAEWKDIQDTKEIFPYLRYVTMQDDAVRDEHSALDGIVRHVDDPFWDEYYPPNGWGCRCGKEQLTEEEANGDPGLKRDVPPDSNVKEEFKRNVGKDNSLFGDWLGCEDAKNLSVLYPEMSIRSKRLHIYNSGKKHCPDLYTKSYKDLDLKDFKEKPNNKQPEEYKTKGTTKKEKLQEYSDYLGNRTIKDSENTPVFLNKKADKHLKDKSLEEISARVKYLNCIDDVIKNPDEIWMHSENGAKELRTYYLKKYSKSVCVITFVDSQGNLEYFNFFPAEDRYIDKQRKGFLIK